MPLGQKSKGGIYHGWIAAQGRQHGLKLVHAFVAIVDKELSGQCGLWEIGNARIRVG